MTDWIRLTLIFVVGVAMGIFVSAYLFESRLRFYKEYIEHRLASINRLRFQNAAKHKPSEPSHDETVFHHPSKREEDSKSSQN